MRDFGVPTPAAVAFVVLGLIWGSNFLFMKWASETISPEQITLLRVLCGFLPVLVYAAVRRDFRRSHLRFAHHFLAGRGAGDRLAGGRRADHLAGRRGRAAGADRGNRAASRGGARPAEVPARPA